MSKNTQIGELINYISVDGSGNVVFTTVPAATTNTDKFLVSDSGVLKFRTATQLLSDIGAQASGSYQAALSGTGFVKISGSTISYDNSTYATETYVGTAISNLVASSPATLDTLNELALALGSDPNFATTVATSIGTKQAQLNGTGFVKVTGTTVSYDNSTYATDSVVVKLTGAQTIAGIKTFQDDIKASSFLYIREQNASTLLANHTQVYANSTYFGFTNGAGTGSAIFTYNGAFNYTLPASAGTLAITSQLHNAVTLGTANGLSLSTQVLSLGLASSSTNGALSSTDWTTFNGKQNALTNPVTGTGTSSYIPKFTGSSAIGNSLIYDTGSIILIGATTASDNQSKLELINNGPVGLKIKSSAGNGNNTFLSIESSKEWRFVTNRGDLISGNQGDLIIRNNTDGINHIILNQNGATTFYSSVNATGFFATTGSNFATASGRVGVGTSTPADKFVVSNGGAEGIEFGFDTGIPYLFGYNRSTSAYKPIAFVGSGNVIITQGTITDNGSKLQVTGAATFSPSGASGIILAADSSDANNSGRLFFMRTGGEGFVIMNNSGNLSFRSNSVPGNTSGNERMRLDTSYNLILNNGLTVAGATNHTGAVRMNNGTGGSSPRITFGTEDESVPGNKSIYLDTYWMILQPHVNEGLRVRFVDGSGTQTETVRFQSTQASFYTNLLPGADATYNLGSTSLRWNNVYTTDLHLSNEGKQNVVDGTWGDWTLQEGENDIFMLNNRSGEKFKIKLEKI